MGLLLYINGQLADLEPGQVIARTLQVNDINSIENRQASYTNKFKVPKTAGNIRLMQFLNLPGNSAAIPYQENACSLYSNTGECFVYNGRAVVTDGGDSYEVVIYDGIIELYKAIENHTLADIGLTELVHDKNVQNVISSWAPGSPYRYIVADYNGRPNNIASGVVNIDYLAPSVNVKWLWDKVFSHYGFTYSGTVFNMANFKNLWMTFPKGISMDEVVTPAYIGKRSGFTEHGNKSYLAWEEEEAEGITVQDGRHFTFDEAALYRIEITGILAWFLSFSEDYEGEFYLARYFPGQYANQTTAFINIASPISPGTNVINFSFTYAFAAHEMISAIVTTPQAILGNLQIKITKISTLQYDFRTALGDFGIRDFLTEIVQRFGLTMYKDKYAPHYTFLTLQEQLQGAVPEDWSDKFISKVSENYISGNYAQRNWFRYSYNDKESSHNDHFLDIDNVNLPDNKDVVKSKIYSPETAPGQYPVRHIYKLWDKEPNDDEDSAAAEPFLYKPLDKRYYFLREEARPGSFTIKSAALQTQQNTNLIYTDSFWKLPFEDIVQEYYKPLQQVLAGHVMVMANMYLSETDVANFDFKKLYYIKQLGSYFLVNKINNFVPGKPVKCELVRVKPNSLGAVREIRITGYNISGNSLIIHFEANYSTGAKKLVINFEEADLVPVQDVAASPVVCPIGMAGTIHYAIHDTTNDIYSDFITVTT